MKNVKWLLTVLFIFQFVFHLLQVMCLYMVILRKNSDL